MAEVIPAHDYVSTACQHGQHERCRKTCKFCQTPCCCTECSRHAVSPAQAGYREAEPARAGAGLNPAGRATAGDHDLPLPQQDKGV
jgi:hypothetical protein